MPKSEQETSAMRLAKRFWSVNAGCDCTPETVPERKGHDLACKHKHVEVKGTGHSRPGFRFLTAGEFDAARMDPCFELWLISSIRGGKGCFHIISRQEVLSTAKHLVLWQLPLGKERLIHYREVAAKREGKPRH
jgi:hypothetical protein